MNKIDDRVMLGCMQMIAAALSTIIVLLAPKDEAHAELAAVTYAGLDEWGEELEKVCQKLDDE